MSAAPSPTVIADIPKNSREVCRVSLSTFRGARLVDVRVHVPGGGPADTLMPTKAGVALAVEKLDELLAAVTQARLEAGRLGWL